MSNMNLLGESHYLSIGFFRITSGLFFKASVGAHPFICKSIFIHMKMSLICVKYPILDESFLSPMTF